MALQVINMNVLDVSPAIKALEEQVILPNRTLNPALGVIIRDDASPDERSYLSSIQKKAKKYNALVKVFEVKDAVKASEAIFQLKSNPGVNGIINLSHFGGADRALNEMIPVRLDIDCVSSYTLGHLIANPSNIGYRLAPCAAVAVYKVLEYHGMNSFAGKRVAILGRSLRVGRPLAEILSQKDATVTVFHSKSKQPILLDRFDIVVSAMGRAKEITSKYFETDAPKTKYIVDVGINLDEDGKICGDVDTDSFKDTDIQITEVPGGIGKLATVVLFAKLFSNAAKATELPEH